MDYRSKQCWTCRKAAYRINHRCSACGDSGPTHFYASSPYKCKECVRAKARDYQRQYYALHREECNARALAYYRRTKKIRQREARAYYARNKERILATMRRQRDRLKAQGSSRKSA